MSKLQELIEKLCPNGVEYKKLCEATEIMRGTRVVKNQLTEIGKYPVYQNCLTPMGYYDKANCSANNVFIIVAGAAGDVGYSHSDFWAADDCFCLLCSENLNSRFLYHTLLSQQRFIYSKVRRASIPRLSRMVVCNDISEGLPAEIEARQKQYEYYRDKLLTFNEI